MTVHRSHAPLSRAPGWFARTVLSVAAVAAWVVMCLADIGAASTYVYFEPTDEALRTAERAASRGEALSVVIVVFAVGIAILRRRRLLLVMALPGIAGFIAFVSHPRGHGLPLVTVLAATLVSGAFAIATSTSRRNRSS
jgi:hypothetical protein